MLNLSFRIPLFNWSNFTNGILEFFFKCLVLFLVLFWFFRTSEFGIFFTFWKFSNFYKRSICFIRKNHFQHHLALIAATVRFIRRAATANHRLVRRSRREAAVTADDSVVSRWRRCVDDFRRRWGRRRDVIVGRLAATGTAGVWRRTAGAVGGGWGTCFVRSRR